MSDSRSYPADAVASVAARLRAERLAAAEQVARLAADLGEIIGASIGVATDDEHDPEGATIAFERAQTSAILDQARARLADLDLAAERLRAGTYFACERCGGPIAADRLVARPASRTCIACASCR